MECFTRSNLDIVEMYEYSRAVRRRFAAKFAEMSWEEVSKNREASFYSMKNILLHIIDNEDWIVNYAIFEKTREYTRKKSEEYATMQMVLEHMNEVEKKTKDYFSTGVAPNPEKELNRQITFELASSGKKFEMTVEECLFQSFTEQLYHIGELIALLWQDNIEPPPMQWFYNSPRTSSGAWP